MGYYIRVLGTKNGNVPLKDIDAALEAKKIPLKISIEGKQSDPWSELTLSHPDGTPICQVEKNPVEPGELGEDEIQEFMDELETAKPASAATWLTKFLPQVKVVYAIQIFKGSDITFGWDVIGAIKETISKKVGGIFQADGEGFSNEEGYHILWQFSDRVKGNWWMAVLDEKGEWIKFQMDLGNRDHRRAFLAGEILEGVARSE